jgi:hypothetical protein
LKPEDESKPDDQSDDSDKPSLRQKLAWATGDRDAEAEALADRSPEGVTVDDAKLAVKRAHGDLGVEQPETESEIATPADAEAASDEHND